MQMAPVATFDRLPSLVKGIICGFLTEEDLKSLRQTCSGWTYYIRRNYGIRLIIQNGNSKYFLSDCAYGQELKKIKFRHFTAAFPDKISFAETLTNVEFASGTTASNAMSILNSLSAIEHLAFTKIKLVRPRVPEVDPMTFNPGAKLKSIRIQNDLHHQLNAPVILDLLTKFDLSELKEFKFDRGETGICQNVFTIAGQQAWTLDATDVRILAATAHHCSTILEKIVAIVKKAAAAKLEVLVLDTLGSFPKVLEPDSWVCPNLKELSITILDFSFWPQFLSAPMSLAIFRVEVFADCLEKLESCLMNWRQTLQELKLVVYYPVNIDVHVEKKIDYLHMFPNLKVLQLEIPRVRKIITSLPKKLEKFLIDTPIWSAEILQIVENSPELTHICLKNIGVCIYTIFPPSALTPPALSLQFFQEILRAPKIEKIVFLHTSTLDFGLVKEYCFEHPGLDWKDESGSFMEEYLLDNLCNAEISVSPEFDRSSI